MASKIQSEEEVLFSSGSISSTSSTITPAKSPSLYVFGGSGVAKGSANRAEKLSFAANSKAWTSLMDMPLGRNYFSGAVVNGIIYVIGGRNAKKEVIQSIDSYDPATGVWKTCFGVKPAYPRSEFGAAAVRDKIFMIGGYADACRRVECYDVTKNEISERRSLERGRWGLGVVYCRGRIYACGGQWYNYRESDEKSRRQTSIYLNDVESYDPIIDRWERESGMLRRRGYFDMAVYEDCIYAVGGMGGECNQRGSKRLDSIEKYDTYTKQWSMIPTRLEGTASNLCVVVVQSKLLAIGGTCDRMQESKRPGANFLSSIQMIDLKMSFSMQTTAKAYPIALTSPRHSFVAVVL